MFVCCESCWEMKSKEEFTKCLDPLPSLYSHSHPPQITKREKAYMKRKEGGKVKQIDERKRLIIVEQR